MYEKTTQEEGPKGTLHFCLRCKSRSNGSDWGPEWVQRILVKDQLKDDKWGEVQGEKEISLTGFLSCTIDSMEIGGREWKTGVEGEMWDQGWKGKGRSLMRFIYNK